MSNTYKIIYIYIYLILICIRHYFVCIRHIDMFNAYAQLCVSSRTFERYPATLRLWRFKVLPGVTKDVRKQLHWLQPSEGSRWAGEIWRWDLDQGISRHCFFSPDVDMWRHQKTKTRLLCWIVNEVQIGLDLDAMKCGRHGKLNARVTRTRFILTVSLLVSTRWSTI